MQRNTGMCYICNSNILAIWTCRRIALDKQSVHGTFDMTTPGDLTHVDEQLPGMIKHPLMPNALRKVIQRLFAQLPQRLAHELLYL